MTPFIAQPDAPHRVAEFHTPDADRYLAYVAACRDEGLTPLSESAWRVVSSPLTLQSMRSAWATCLMNMGWFGGGSPRCVTCGHWAARGARCDRCRVVPA